MLNERLRNFKIEGEVAPLINENYEAITSLSAKITTLKRLMQGVLPAEIERLLPFKSKDIIVCSTYRNGAKCSFNRVKEVRFSNVSGELMEIVLEVSRVRKDGSIGNPLNVIWDPWIEWRKYEN